jgi:hypothetical protein
MPFLPRPATRDQRAARSSSTIGTNGPEGRRRQRRAGPDELLRHELVAPLFTYRVAPTVITTDAVGRASLAMAAQSIQVLRLERVATPFGVAMYVRGSMNDWADPPPPSAQLACDGHDVYNLTLHLSAGEQLFKIAPADWSVPMMNLGAIGGRTVALDHPLVLEQTRWLDGGVGADLRLDVASEGDYSFSVDATNVRAPVLTVRAVQR